MLTFRRYFFKYLQAPESITIDFTTLLVQKMHFMLLRNKDGIFDGNSEMVRTLGVYS